MVANARNYMSGNCRNAFRYKMSNFGESMVQYIYVKESTIFLVK